MPALTIEDFQSCTDWKKIVRNITLTEPEREERGIYLHCMKVMVEDAKAAMKKSKIPKKVQRQWARQWNRLIARCEIIWTPDNVLIQKQLDNAAWTLREQVTQIEDEASFVGYVPIDFVTSNVKRTVERLTNS